MAIDNPIRFGILGCARIARKLSRAITLAPNAILYAIGSRSLDKAEAFAAGNGFPPSAKIYDSYEAVLDDPDVDAVYIPLPTSLHVHWAVLAAQKKKHLLLEKPVAINTGEFDKILEACETNSVQFMDCTMWMHHPRTAKLGECLSDSQQFGQLTRMNTSFSYAANDDFLNNNIRVKPDLDALGALGDAGWYCIRAILFATNYELPKTVTALHGTIFNDAGVILSCGASLHWEDEKIATFHCSFLTTLTTDMNFVGTKGHLHVNDFVIPMEEKEASFTFGSCRFNDLGTGWVPLPSKHLVRTDLPQEALMVKEFGRLVEEIKYNGASPEKIWPIICRRTQQVVDAVKASIERDCVSIQVDLES